MSAALYGTSKENFHDSLVDRQTERSTSSDAINLALLDYKSPLEYAINDNIGDHIQSLSVMRHIARFYTDESFLSNDSLKDVFRFLAESWNPEERSQPSAPLNMVIMDRDCRPNGSYCLATFLRLVRKISARNSNDIPSTRKHTPDILLVSSERHQNVDSRLARLPQML